MKQAEKFCMRKSLNNTGTNTYSTNIKKKRKSRFNRRFADLPIIVVLVTIAVRPEQSKRIRKIFFKGIYYINYRIALLSGSAVHCKPLELQNKREDSFPQAPGFYANGSFTFVVYCGADNFHLTDRLTTYTGLLGLNYK